NTTANFANKCIGNPIMQENFYKCINQLKLDVQNFIGKRGVHLIQESLEKPFGKDIVTKAFSNYGEKQLRLRETGGQFMASGTGIIGTEGTVIKNHHFYGKEDQ
ncbi:MAG: nucleotidyltransferase, partial [bacterium]